LGAHGVTGRKKGDFGENRLAGDLVALRALRSAIEVLREKREAGESVEADSPEEEAAALGSSAGSREASQA
jgi:hypothetical protein